MPRYQYAPLEARSKELRLIYLLPGPFDDELTIRLVHVSFAKAQKLQYEALSYTWGTPEDPQTITVERLPPSRHAIARLWRAGVSGGKLAHKSDDVIDSSSSEAGTLPVTHNLAVALRHLRRTETQRLLWVDAICIDQQNKRERSIEVARMGEIYRKASQVVVWLGPQSLDSELAMDTLSLLSGRVKILDENSDLSYIHTKANSTDPLNEALAARRAAVSALLQRPWFTRLWVWQELILATKVSVVCGLYEMPWVDFRLALNMTMGLVQGGDAMHGCLDGMLTDHILRMMSFRVAQPLNTIIDYTKHCQCTDARDRIYGILNLLPKGFQLDIKPDYSKSPEEVYMDVCFTVFARSIACEMLSFCEMPHPPTWKRSWVPDLSTPRLTSPINHCHASGLTMPAYRVVGEKLLVRGVDVDTVSYVSSPVVQNANVKEVVASIRGWVATFDGTGLDLRCPDLVFAFVCALITRQFTVEYILSHEIVTTGESMDDLVELMAQGADEDLPEALLQGPFMQTVIDTLPGRRAFRTSKGYFGLGPAAIEVGDHTCVVLGSRVPLALRPSVQQVKHNLVVGSCFVTGLMDKEAFLGPLPPPLWGKVLVSDGPFSRLYSQLDGSYTQEDPRLGPLPAGWTRCEQEQYHGGQEMPALQTFRRRSTRTFYDPRLSCDALIARGVEVKVLTLC